MPIYDYRCVACGNFEYSQSIKDEPLTECPSCGNQVKRLISNNVGIIFKGSGFYINDSRSSANGRNNGEVASASGEKTQDTKADGSSADRPAEKPAGQTDKPVTTSSDKAS